MILNWHQVSPFFNPHTHHRNTWTSLETFTAVIDFIIKRFRVVSLPNAVHGLQSGEVKGQCVALTFDDGDISIADYVKPLLCDRDLPATFFVNTAYLERPASYWVPILSYLTAASDLGSELMPVELREKALRLRTTDDPEFYNTVRHQVEQLAPLVPNLQSRLVSSKWLSQLDGDQFTIGLHGHEHERFSMMSAQWQREDLQKNIEILSQFRSYQPIFAVPFGRPPDWNTETVEIANELGLDVVLADGGVNLGPQIRWARQPADSLAPGSLITRAAHSILQSKCNRSNI